MSIWAIADLHLSFGVPEKSMEVFGPQWNKYAERIHEHWHDVVAVDDLILIAGDISWATALKDAKVDLDWIDALPGTKVVIKGNHDYWWSSRSKVEQILPSSIHLVQNDAFNWNDISIGGTRLWDSEEYNFSPYIAIREGTTPPKPSPDSGKIFNRELERLELSLKALNQSAKSRIVMTHYPPIGADLQPSRVSALLEKYHVDTCVFGHLHSLKKGVELFGEHRGIRYALTSCDYLDFRPIKLL